MKYNRLSIKLFILSLFLSSCSLQLSNQSYKPRKKIISTGIWECVNKENSNVILIFEKGFKNDSLVITLGDSVILKSTISTKSTGSAASIVVNRTLDDLRPIMIGLNSSKPRPIISNENYCYVYFCKSMLGLKVIARKNLKQFYW